VENKRIEPLKSLLGERKRIEIMSIEHM